MDIVRWQNEPDDTPLRRVVTLRRPTNAEATSDLRRAEVTASEPPDSDRFGGTQCRVMDQSGLLTHSGDPCSYSLRADPPRTLMDTPRSPVMAPSPSAMPRAEDDTGSSIPSRPPFPGQESDR